MHELDVLWRLGLALVLSSAIGVERETRQKSAGLRTYSLVGVGAAVFMLVSAYGFSDVVRQGHVALDPSRVAAQIVSGIGFIGGGIIFVRGDAVRGLTTAAGVWVTAAVGMACGGDLPLIGIATTVIYFAVTFGYPRLVRFLPRSLHSPSDLQLIYLDGHGILRAALAECAQRGFSISNLSIRGDGTEGAAAGSSRIVTVEVEVRGRGSIAELASEIHEIEGVIDVRAPDAEALERA